MERHELLSLCARAIECGILASAAIMKVYDTPFGYDIKEDGSPITIADKKSSQIISDALGKTGIQIINEENKKVSFEIRRNWESFWLVDPLDGTKDFINRNDEFAINMALVKGTTPILGVIISPVMQKVWWGLAGLGNFVFQWKENSAEIDSKRLIEDSKPININYQNVKPSILISRFHLDPETEAIIEEVMKRLPNLQVVTRGSSLKYCDIVEGRATIHFRYSSGTSEWDTAAGHAMLLAAGGNIFNIDNQEPLQYNKPDLKNPGFVAFSSREHANAILFEANQEN